MYPRYSQKKIAMAMQDTPVVIMIGPRQCGKTTLVKQYESETCQFVTLDNLVQYETAKDDPIGFIQNLTADTLSFMNPPGCFYLAKVALDLNLISLNLCWKLCRWSNKDIEYSQ